MSRTTAAGAWVIVRRVDLTCGSDVVAAAAGCLTRAELDRAARGTPEVRARRILVRGALRELVGELVGVPAREVALASRPGRPALDTRARADLDLSCSASGAVGLVAVARGARIGVDVQRLLDEDPDTAVAEGWLSAAEHRRIAALPYAERRRELTRAWVQKEAVLKGQGVGLRADLSGVRSVPRDHGRIGPWRVSAVDVRADHLACVAVRMSGLIGRLAYRRPVVL